MRIELADELQAALEKRAAEAGISVSAYANLLILEQINEDRRNAHDRAEAIDALIDHGKGSIASSGRAGRGWRDFIHEGHSD